MWAVLKRVDGGAAWSYTYVLLDVDTEIRTKLRLSPMRSTPFKL